MLNIGCKLSVSKGYLHMGEEALSINANTFQFFSRSPREATAKDMNTADAKALLDLVGANNFAPLLVHAPYALNACSDDPGIREHAHRVIKEDLANMEYIPGNMYNFHPGSHVGQGIGQGIAMVADLLNRTLRPEQPTLVLLETMAGRGSQVGSSFREVRSILERVELTEKMGVCLDICHVYSAGYDIVNDLEGVLESFDMAIGLDRLRAIHLNDSIYPIGSRKDRHAPIVTGTIGLEAIANIINHPLLKKLPFFLETPHDDIAGYGREIKLLRDVYAG